MLEAGTAAYQAWEVQAQVLSLYTQDLGMAVPFDRLVTADSHRHMVLEAARDQRLGEIAPALVVVAGTALGVGHPWESGKNQPLNIRKEML